MGTSLSEFPDKRPSMNRSVNEVGTSPDTQSVPWNLAAKSPRTAEHFSVAADDFKADMSDVWIRAVRASSGNKDLPAHMGPPDDLWIKAMRGSPRAEREHARRRSDGLEYMKVESKRVPRQDSASAAHGRPGSPNAQPLEQDNTIRAQTEPAGRHNLHLPELRAQVDPSNAAKSWYEQR